MRSLRWRVTLLLTGVSMLFLAPHAEAQLALTSVPPCRIVDTRNANGPTGGPALSTAGIRSFSITGVCGVPSDARAAVLHFTTLDATGGGYLTVWPADTALPVAALLQFGPGQSGIVTNSAHLGLATDPMAAGLISAFIISNAPPATVHLIIDVFGYYAEIP